MASSNSTSYANAHARARILYAELLSEQAFSNAREAADFSMLMTQLKETAYGPYLSRVEERDLNPRRAVYQLKLRLAEAYQQIIHATPDQARPLLQHLYRHFELDNLKAILRGIMTGSTWEQVRYVLFPLGGFSTLPGETMVESGNIGSAVEQLHDTPYYQVLTHALQRYTAEQSLFPLEVALDLDYWRRLWEYMKRLPEGDRASALQILGNLVDVTNLMWAVRYRVYHNLSEEEIINYTLPFGYHLRDADVRAIAAGGDIGNIVERVYSDLDNVNNLLQQTGRGLSLLETLLQRTVTRRCHEAFTGYPFQVGVELAILVLMEMEIQDLTVLIEAKAANMPEEAYDPYLVIAAGETARGAALNPA